MVAFLYIFLLFYVEEQDQNVAVLIVDDNKANRTIFKSILKRSGYTDLFSCCCAEEAYVALGMTGENPIFEFELILMDIMMPKISGIEAVTAIKAEECIVDIPIIMATAATAEENLVPALEAGAMDFLNKPIQPFELRARAKAAIRLYREIKARKMREEELRLVTARLEEANNTLEKMALMDSLTGIPNRRAFEQVVQRQCQLNLRRANDNEHQPCSAAMMIDIDNFKRYNDTYGHQAGDDALAAVAKAIHDALLRPGDFCCRYGGEEFSVLMSDTPPEGAIIVAERVRQAVCDLGIRHSANEGANVVTISAGLVCGELIDLKSAIKIADSLLYRSKEGGRNRVTSETTAQEIPKSKLPATG